MTSAAEIFQSAAASYDEARRRLIPPFESFYGTAVSALALAGDPLRQVLDLGAGTGLLAERVAAAYPEARLTLLDGAPAMLAEARARVGGAADLVTGDLGEPLPTRPMGCGGVRAGDSSSLRSEQARVVRPDPRGASAGRRVRQR
jgi:tRNA (cmo5U34)-methyltransferase